MNRIKILCVITGWIPSAIISLKQPLEYLSKKEILSAKFVLEEHVSFEDILTHHIIIFQRITEPFMIKYLNYANKLGKTTIYDLDDNFFCIQRGSYIGDYYNQLRCKSTLEYFIKNCTYIKITSDELRNAVFKYNTNIIQFNSSIDEKIISNFAKPDLVDNTNKKFVIGYAGTIGREKDFEFVTAALNKIVKKYPDNISIEFFGFDCEDLHKLSQYTHFKYNSNYEEFLETKVSRKWDLALAPLKDTIGNRSKTNNKFREYAICSIPAIYSLLPVYENCVKNEVTGLLVRNVSDEWFDAIEKLYLNESLREKIRENAYDFVSTNYSVSSVSKEWETFFSTINLADTHVSTPINSASFIDKVTKQSQFSSNYKLPNQNYYSSIFKIPNQNHYSSFYKVFDIINLRFIINKYLRRLGRINLLIVRKYNSIFHSIQNEVYIKTGVFHYVALNNNPIIKLKKRFKSNIDVIVRLLKNNHEISRIAISTNSFETEYCLNDFTFNHADMLEITTLDCEKKASIMLCVTNCDNQTIK